MISQESGKKSSIQNNGPSKPPNKICKLCGHVELESQWVPFLEKWRPPPDYCDKCQENADEKVRKNREYQIKQGRTINIDIHLMRAGVGAIYRKATMSDFQRLPLAAKDFMDGTAIKNGLYLCGPGGTGKTHLAVAITRCLIENLKNPLFVSVPELLLGIRACFIDRSGISEKETINKYADAHVLILDDLGAEKTTDYVLQVFYIILDRRYRENRVTIITSNLEIKDLAKKLNSRIASRIAGLCEVVEFVGRDRRI